MQTGFIIYKQSANLRRLSRDSVDADLEGYINAYCGLRLNIQPAGLEYTAGVDGAMGKVFKAFTSYSGCAIGMQIVTSGTVTISGMMYDIIGIEPWNGPIGKHWELLLRLNVN